MKDSYLDRLPHEVQQAIYNRFMKANVKDKIIFLSRLEYGNELSYRDISDKVGVSFKRVQFIVDRMMTDVKDVLTPSGAL